MATRPGFRPQIILAVVLSALPAMVLLTLTCRRNTPSVPLQPFGPDTVFAGVAATYRTAATDPQGKSIRYAFDWEDGSVDTTAATPSGDTASIAHIWSNAGTFNVSALAIAEDGRVSEGWATARKVTVKGNSAPNAPETPQGPIWIVPYRRDSIVVWTRATDPDGDSVYIRFQRDTTEPAALSPWYGPVAGGTWVRDTIALGRQLRHYIAAWARDTRGAVSARSPVYEFCLAERSLNWLDSSDGAATFAYTPAILVLSDSTVLVFAGTDGDSLFRFADDGSGQPRQRRVAPGDCDCVLEDSPVLSGDNQRVYLAWGDGMLYCYSVDLHLLDEYRPDTSRRVFTMPAVSSTELYAGFGESLFSLHDDGGTISRNWAFGAGSEIEIPPVITAGGNIVFGTESTGVFCVTPAGAPVWNARLPARMSCGAAVGADGRVYLGCANGRLYGMDIATGDTVFSSADSGAGPSGSQVVGSPVIDQEGVIYVCRNEGSVTAYTPAGPNTAGRWQRVLTNTAFLAGPCLAPDTTIVVHSEDDYLYAINTPDGTIRWPFKLPCANRGRGRDWSGVGATPVVGPRFGLIYVGAAGDRFFFAVEIGEDAYAAGLPAAPWPKFQGGLGNQGRAGALLH